MTLTSANPQVPVLIVGAGPVGLVAAIRLREQGKQVRIIDDQTASDKRTYPAVLHPRTLQILDSLGVRASLEWRGRVIKQLAIYTENVRRVVLDIPSAEEVAGGAMTLPQDLLRQALTARLSSLGTDVEWATRLATLEQDEAAVTVNLVRRERAPVSALELKPEWLDVASESVSADFVIGADGRDSTVRGALGIQMVPRGPRELFAFYDAPDARAGAEAQLLFNGSNGSTVYPLQGDFSRYSFQLDVGSSHPPGLTQLRELLTARMPWYSGDINRFEWSGNTEFHPALAQRFGEGRVWLAGDAAHSTGPLGAQSINVGMHEANTLASHILEKLENPTFSLGRNYTEQRRLEWSRLFGLGASAPNLAHAPAWVSQSIAKLLPSLPASGDDLDDLLEQLRVRTA